jgi:hypothetical protein
VAKLRFENHSFSFTGDVASRDVMKMMEMRQCMGQLDDVARATDIYTHREVFGDGEIVNRGEMKHTRRLLLDQIEIRGAQRQPRLADVALDKLKLAHISAAEVRDPRDLLAGAAEQ